MPREGSQESILVCVCGGGPVPERYLKFLEGEAETSSTQTQQSLGYVCLLSLREISSVLATGGLRPFNTGLNP